MPGHFCYPACCSNVQCVHGVLAAHLSKFQKRADLKENLSLANVIRLQLSRKCAGRIGIHLFFDSMKELGH